jgi:hypothetical protein
MEILITFFFGLAVLYYISLKIDSKMDQMIGPHIPYFRLYPRLKRKMLQEIGFYLAVAFILGSTITHIGYVITR